MFPRFHKYYRFILLTSLVCLLFFGGSRVFADEFKEYKFGVFPFMPIAALSKYYNSVAIDFTRLLNKRVIALSRPTFTLFKEEITKETYDIIFIQPFDYPIAYQHNYRPLARRIDSLDAILVTKIDSSVKSINDLEGKIIANPPEESAISIVIQKDITNAGLDRQNSIKMIYTANHFACIQMVLVGKADACSTTTSVLLYWQNTRLKKKKLQTIHQSDTVPHTLYMVHQRVPEKDKQKIKQAIITWDERPVGKTILKIFNVKSFVEAKDSEYDVIRNFWK